MGRHLHLMDVMFHALVICAGLQMALYSNSEDHCRQTRYSWKDSVRIIIDPH